MNVRTETYKSEVWRREPETRQPQISNAIFDERDLQHDIAHTQKSQDDMSAGSDRNATKRKLAEIALREQRRAAITKTIRQIDSDLDSAVAQHAETTAPIQSAIKKLDAEVINAMLTSGPSEVLERQRGVQMANLETANLALQSACEKLNSRRKLLETELNSPELNTNAKGGLENALISTAPDEMQHEKHSLECEATWLGRRLAHAKERFAVHDAFLKNHGREYRRHPEELRMLEQRVARWRAELDSATKAQSDSSARMAALLERMRNS